MGAQQAVAKGTYLPSVALATVNSLVQLGGVALLGWPVGNIFLLLWCENVIITLLAVSRMVGVRDAPDGGMGQKVIISFGLLFFCLVHGVFSVVLAYVTGLNLTMVMFATPLVLLVLRYAVETLGWYAKGERPRTLSEAHGFAMRRVIMLHVAILVCWAIMVRGLVSMFGDGAQSLPSLQLALLGALLLVKTVAEIRAIRLGPNVGTAWKFRTT